MMKKISSLVRRIKSIPPYAIVFYPLSAYCGLVYFPQMLSKAIDKELMPTQGVILPPSVLIMALLGIIAAIVGLTWFIDQGITLLKTAGNHMSQKCGRPTEGKIIAVGGSFVFQVIIFIWLSSPLLSHIGIGEFFRKLFEQAPTAIGINIAIVCVFGFIAIVLLRSKGYSIQDIQAKLRNPRKAE